MLWVFDHSSSTSNGVKGDLVKSETMITMNPPEKIETKFPTNIGKSWKCKKKSLHLIVESSIMPVATNVYNKVTIEYKLNTRVYLF